MPSMYDIYQDLKRSLNAGEIEMCASWRRGFVWFFEDVEKAWTPGAVLERIDENAPYSPENYRWVNKKEETNGK